MRTSIYSFITLSVLLAFGNAYANPIQLDPDNPESFKYLKLNVDKLYEDNYQLFWKIYWGAERRATNCTSADDTAEFLELGPIVLGKSDLQEAFAKSIEHFLVKNPKCFLDGTIRIGDKHLLVLVTSYLKVPLYVDDASIKNALAPYKNMLTYKRLMSLYFKEKE